MRPCQPPLFWKFVWKRKPPIPHTQQQQGGGRGCTLCIIRNYVNKLTLRTIYFAIFDSHINYANIIWGQNPHTLSRFIILQKKTLIIINFQSRDSYSSPLFRSNHILKLEDKILIKNILFINKSFNNLLPPNFKSWFNLCSDLHNYCTVSSTADKIFKQSYRTDSDGKN